jgi:pimeloyl-ACP methyl ester carboxylesterase
VRTLLTVLAVLPVVVVVYFTAVWVLQRSVLFPAPGTPGFDAALAAPGVEKIRVGVAGQAEAWFYPPASATRFPVLVFGHGNGELIDHWVLDFQTPRSWGVGVLLVEFPGYGRSGGAPTEESITRAFVDAYDALAERPEVSAIVGYGRSMGGGAVCQLAKHRELAALILESSFTSVTEMARGLGVPRWLVRDPFDSQSVLAGFPRPILLVHGTRDAIVPFRHAESNHAVAAASELHPVACGHNDCPRPWALVRRFLEHTGLIEPAEPTG